MAQEKTTSVELVVNDETKDQVEVSEITSVEIRGATGVARYRLDPSQDVVIKLVVTGKVAQEEGELPEAAPVSTENVAAYFGRPEDVKDVKDREKKVKEDKEKADKEAAEAANKQKKETEHVGEAKYEKEPATTARNK